MNITLIGYRGTGKSTVARLVAQRLGWNWVDADARIEERSGRSIREIFEMEGETGFRLREAAVVQELMAGDRTVIAAGGGAVLRPENREAIRKAGITVWLTASAETIKRRLTSDPITHLRRPALTSAGGDTEIRQLLRDREPLYRACADLAIDTDQYSPEQVAEQIVEAASAKLSSSSTE